MKASELIKKLENLKAKFGDKEVFVYDCDFGDFNEIDECVGVDDDECFVVESDSDINGFAVVPGHLAN
jgi:hypothetical protein